jgi:hypothetical protein
MLAAAMPMYDTQASWAQAEVANNAEKHNWKPS